MSLAPRVALRIDPDFPAIPPSQERGETYSWELSALTPCMSSGSALFNPVEQCETPSFLSTLLSYYGLNEQPFGLTPDPRFLYFTASHREALAALSCGIETERGFMTLIAPPGMGKTTLLFRLFDQYKDATRTAFVFQTQCNSREFLGHLLTDLGTPAGEQSLAQMHEKLYEILLSEASAGKRVVFFVDEAHNLDSTVLETVRLLSDLEKPGAKLMQIVLAGHPSLIDKLLVPALRQRISIQARLGPLALADVSHYIDHRLQVAGYTGGPLFTPEARELLSAQSEGVPRNINNLCFHALLSGFALARKTIDADIIQEVSADLEMRPASEEIQNSPSKRVGSEYPSNGDSKGLLPLVTGGDRPVEISSEILESGKLIGPNGDATGRAPKPEGEATEKNAKKALDPALAGLLEETCNRLQVGVDAIAEELSNTDSRLRKLEEERLAGSKGLQLQTDQIQRQISDLRNVLEPLADLRTWAGKMESLVADGELTNRVARADQQIQLGCQQADEVASRIAVAAEAATEKLHAANQELGSRAAGVVDELRQAAGDLLKSSAERLGKQAGEIAEQFQEEVSTVLSRCLEETKEQFLDLTWAPLDAEQLKTVTDRYRTEFLQMIDECVTSGVRQLEAKSRQLRDHPKEALETSFGLREAPEQAIHSTVAPARPPAHLTMTKMVAVALAFITPVLVFIFLSIQPVMRLRPDPPAGFFEVRQDWSAKRRAAEDRLARSYWESAVLLLPSKYGFGAKLPDDPPPEFMVDETELAGAGPKSDTDARSRYWRKFCQVAKLPQTWQESDVWNTHWLGAWFASIRQIL
jgi:general secretion pathway protein A